MNQNWFGTGLLKNYKLFPKQVTSFCIFPQTNISMNKGSNSPTWVIITLLLKPYCKVVSVLHYRFLFILFILFMSSHTVSCVYSLLVVLQINCLLRWFPHLYAICLLITKFKLYEFSILSIVSFSDTFSPNVQFYWLSFLLVYLHRS